MAPYTPKDPPTPAEFRRYIATLYSLIEEYPEAKKAKNLAGWVRRARAILVEEPSGDPEAQEAAALLGLLKYERDTAKKQL